MNESLFPEWGDRRVGLFVVIDKAAEIISPVFEQSSVESAKRVFLLKTLRELPDVCQKDDFELWQLGWRDAQFLTSEVVFLLRGEKGDMPAPVVNELKAMEARMNGK